VHIVICTDIMIIKNMKKQIKSFKNLFFVNTLVILFFLWSAYAANKVAENIAVQTSSGTGSSNSQITFLSWAYINTWNNSTVIGNYFQGYYYDSVYGFFHLNWDDAELKNNVHISGSTDKCSSWYGYKLGGYAYSENFGFIDFDYDSASYVYYCLADKQLHGYAYSEIVGFQNFEAIWFEIITSSDITVNPNATSNDGFTNDSTTVSDSPTSNYQPQPNKIWTDTFEFRDTDESIFYIIK